MHCAMPLLGRIAIGAPDLWPMPFHQLAHDDGAPGWSGAMHDSFVRSEHLLIGVRALDAHTCFVRGDDLRPAQVSIGRVALGHEGCLRPPQHVHQAALADPEPKKVRERALQTFEGQRLKRLEIGRHGIMRGPKGVPFAASGTFAATSNPQDGHRTERRRWRSTKGWISGSSIVSYSPAVSAGKSSESFAWQ